MRFHFIEKHLYVCLFLMIAESLVSHTTASRQVPVQIVFQGVSYPNNSVLSLNDIGDINVDGNTLRCITNKNPCCYTYSNRFGQWYYPNGSLVPINGAGEDFYRSRDDDQTIFLSRRNNAQSPTGSFCCELPDNNDVTYRLCATLVAVTITPSGNLTAGNRFTLNCSIATSQTNTPIFTWFLPSTENSDTRTVSYEMPSTSTHASILEFDPLKMSHEGKYTCQVTVGTLRVMKSAQVNVTIPPPIAVTVTGSPDGTISTGSSITLTCLIELNEYVDTAVTVNTMWSGPSDGTQFTTTTSVATIMTATTYTSKATISSVKTSDSGEYTCTTTVSSTSTTSEEASGSHDVTIVLPAPKNIVVTEIQSTSVTLTWTQPEEEVADNYVITYSYQGPCPRVVQTETEYIDGSRREFTAANLHEYSNYTITIVASNDAGDSSPVITTTTTLPKAPSGPPQHLTVISRTLSSITIQWDEVECLEQNSQITGYSVTHRYTTYYYWQYKSVSTNISGASNRTFTATGIPPHTDVTFEVTAISEIGIGPSGRVTRNTVMPTAFGFLLNGVLHSNNSIVTLDEIGDYQVSYHNDTSTVLFCLTNKSDCCGLPNRAGQFFYPNGSQVNTNGYGYDFFRTRGPSAVRLQRRNNGQTAGVFRCEVPDASGTNQQLYIGVYPVDSGSPSVTDIFYNQSTLTLTCTSTGGPATTVTWRKNGVVIEADGTTLSYHHSQMVVDTETATYENNLSSNNVAGLVGTFTCTVGNSRGTSSWGITINGVVVHGADQPLAIGEKATISCTSDAPATSIEWLDSERRVVASETSIDQLDLSFNPVNDSIHDSVYTCQVTRGDRMVEENTKLTVSVPPDAITATITSSGSTTAGQEYTLVCSTSAIHGLTNTPIATWFYPNNSRVMSGHGITISPHTMSSTSTLTFPILTNSHGGEYICVGGIESPALSSPLTVQETLNFAVRKPVINATVYGGNPVVGAAYSLTCNITGYGRINPVITYQWSKDNTLVTDETKSILSFSSLSLSDAGQYSCNVTVSSNGLSQSLSAVSSTKALSLKIPSPIVSLTVSPGGNSNTRNPSLVLTCTIGLSVSKAVDVPVTVNTVWSGPSETQFTSIATRENDTTYTSTATYSSAVSSNTGEYTCRVTISSTHSFVGNSDEVIGSKGVKDVLQRFQLKLRRTDDCISWSANQAKEIRSYIFDELLQAINARCQCELPKENLLNGVFSCLDSREQTTYRSTIIGTQSITATQLEGYLEDWVTSDPTLTIQWYTVKLDTNCSVSISSLGDPECTMG